MKIPKPDPNETPNNADKCYGGFMGKLCLPGERCESESKCIQDHNTEEELDNLISEKMKSPNTVIEDWK
jgi:hypothetical protein